MIAGEEGIWGIKADCSTNFVNLEIEVSPTNHIKRLLILSYFMEGIYHDADLKTHARF